MQFIFLLICVLHPHADQNKRFNIKKENNIRLTQILLLN